ncbi:MAG: SUMF1/EgtB/PvdO family nonheme iron enzyme [Planctomycetes bacterium]|nr:SUMF1/EgtB/PvdO family nonheme iron enzyme [Planctomycetota bacterium]
MGSVYLAEQRQPVRRRVALKVIKKGMDSKAFLTRFEAERQALAMMEHSCIAKIFDAGTTESGQPWLAMEYVKGVPITDYCDQNSLSLEGRLALFREVCAGIQHAHQKGVMHRDLKPSNVLVTVQEGKPMPKIIDFGLAKAVDHRLVESTLFTEAGVMLGTPEYMSPEQARIGGLDVDTRTDVYSLGVMLYQLLTGSLPVSKSELLRYGWSEMQRVIREEEPKKPSTRITTLGAAAEASAKARRIPLRDLQRRLEGELDWIVMKSLEKDRSRRYQTAQELAADLQRHLNNEPVTAGPPTAGYLLHKVFLRYRVAALTGAAVVAALGVGLAVALVQWQTARLAEERAEANAAEARKERDTAQELLARFERLRNSVKARQEWQRLQSSPPPELVANLPEYEARMALAEQLLPRRNEVEVQRDALRQRGSAQGASWSFPDLSEQLHHDSLCDFLASCSDFSRPEGGMAQIRRAVEYLRKELPGANSDRSAAWAVAARELAEDPRFRGLRLTPQEGLVPLGRDANSGLQEFWAVRSGDRPVSQSGRWCMTETSGMVLVLLPGGSSQIGSDAKDAVGIERPVHEVLLEPFFLSKYELTQGQWLRLTTEKNPSRYKPAPDAPFNLSHPVEGVRWAEAQRLVTHFGWSLPTEAQWEHACRAGTPTRWYLGDRREDLALPDGKIFRGKFNAADGFLSRADGRQFVEDARHWPELDDGSVVHAPVGQFLYPNGFGLYDMHGNVAEWTRGTFGPYSECTHQAGDGELLGGDETKAAHRGGSFYKSVEEASSSMRKAVAKDSRYDNIGIRVARALQ